MVIDYEIAMIMLPSTFLGALLGVQLNTIMPDILILFVLTGVLIFMGFKSLKSGIKKYQDANKIDNL